MKNEKFSFFTIADSEVTNLKIRFCRYKRSEKFFKHIEDWKQTKFRKLLLQLS